VISSSPVISERYVYAGMAICVTMMVSLLWMPALLGVLSQGFEISPRGLSYLAFAELSGFVVGSLLTSNKTHQQLTRWVLISCALISCANVTLLLFAPAVPFMILRPIAGLGSGVGFGYSMKLCTASVKPTRNFGLLTASMSLMMVIGFQTLAYLVHSRGTLTGIADADSYRIVAKLVFGIYVVLAGGAAVILLSNLPASSTVAEIGQRPLHGRLGRSVLLCVVAIVFTFLGQGAIWAFLQTLGISHGFVVEGVANAMSVYALMGIVGSLGAAALPGPVLRWVAMGIALVLLWIGLYALYSPVSLASYIGGCAIVGFYWNFALSLMLGLLARVDQSGRGSVLGGTMSSTGSAIGPLFAGFLIEGSNYQPVGWLVGVLSTTGLACIWLVERRNKAVSQRR
jgi:predicted MFS family arabinose efflux permease